MVVNKKKKVKKISNKSKKCLSNKTTTTSILPTTPYYMKSWGYFENINIIKNKKLIKKKIHIEQINPSFFAYNYDGEKGFAEVEDLKKYGHSKRKGFLIDNIIFILPQNVFYSPNFYNVPSVHDVKAWVKGNYKVRSYKELHEEIRIVIKELFDFSDPLDIETTALAIGESWIKPLLDEFFFYGIDSTKGGGKTTLGEIVYFLMRHGFCGGDISPAAAIRLINELDLNVFVDEIDQNSKDIDLMAAFRKGQRRNNPYVRCEGRDNNPKVYDLAGCHGFSFRSELEDAFMDRTLRVHTTQSKDHRLAVINSKKRHILKPLADELFFWHLENVYKGVVGREGVAGNLSPKQFNRNSLYNDMISMFSPRQKELLKKVFGRNSELTYLSLKTGKILGIDIVENLAKILEKRESDQESSENLYYELLIQHIIKNKSILLEKTLKEGVNATFPFFPKTLLYTNFLKQLNESKIAIIGSRRFNSLLRDLGFVESVTITSQRYESYPAACLIFTPKIQKKIGLIDSEEDYK